MDADGATLYASSPAADGGEGRIAVFTTEDDGQGAGWALPAGTSPRGLAHAAGLLYVAASPAAAGAAGPAELLIYAAPSGELQARWALADNGTTLAVAVDPGTGAVYTATAAGNGSIIAKWGPYAAGAPTAAPSRLWQVAAEDLGPVTQLAADAAAGTLLVAGARAPVALSAASGQRLAELGGGCAAGGEVPCPAARAVGVAVDGASRLAFVSDEALQRIDVYRSM